MADTPDTGETVTPGDSQTTATTTSAPATDNASAAEVERLRKENEQRELRIRQLENERQARDKADDEAKAKQLEEQEEWKQLAEKREAELKELRETQERAERQTQLNTATENVFKDYPTEVVELAQTAGLTLSDDSEPAIATLKEKLDAFKAKVAPGNTVTSSNPAPTAPAETGEAEALGKPKQLGVDTGQTPITETNKRKVGDYISGLSAVERMKQDAGVLPRT